MDFFDILKIPHCLLLYSTYDPLSLILLIYLYQADILIFGPFFYFAQGRPPHHLHEFLS